MKKEIAIAAALWAMPVIAHAEQPNLYIGGVVGDYTFDPPGPRASNATDLGLRLGYHFSDFIGIEGRLGRATGGISGNPDDEVTYGGVFARFDLPFEKVNVYFLVGASDVGIRGSSVDSDEHDPISGGVGVELYGSERTAITFEYMNYSEGLYEGGAIGLKYHFNLPAFR